MGVQHHGFNSASLWVRILAGTVATVVLAACGSGGSGRTAPTTTTVGRLEVSSIAAGHLSTLQDTLDAYQQCQASHDLLHSCILLMPLLTSLREVVKSVGSFANDLPAKGTYAAPMTRIVELTRTSNLALQGTWADFLACMGRIKGQNGNASDVFNQCKELETIKADVASLDALIAGWRPYT